MRRLVVLLAVVLIGALAPLGASAQDVRVGSGMRPDDAGADRPPAHRPRPPRPPFGHQPGFPCCVGWSYLPAEPPPPVITVPPPIVYVVPAPPTLTYVAPARVEPAPEIQTSSGRWERHGNGKEYPYTWVWVGAAAAGTR